MFLSGARTPSLELLVSLAAAVGSLYTKGSFRATLGWMSSEAAQ
jgi:hypothetical protein